MKPYAILHPYVLRARILPDFTLPDGRTHEAPPEAARMAFQAPGWPAMTVTRAVLAAEVHLTEPSPEALQAGYLALGRAMAKGFERELSRPMTPSEFPRLVLSRGWLL